MAEEPWAGTGGLSEHGFLYFILAIFITYVILLTWLRGTVNSSRGNPTGTARMGWLSGVIRCEPFQRAVFEFNLYKHAG